MTRLPVVRHLPPEEIDRRYRSYPDAAEKTRWHVLWPVTRLDNPVSATAAAKLVGLTPASERAILKRYNEHGPGGSVDGRQDNGATPDQQTELFAALQAEPADGGLRSGP